MEDIFEAKFEHVDPEILTKQKDCPNSFPAYKTFMIAKKLPPSQIGLYGQRRACLCIR